MDATPPAERRPPTASGLSQTPSWIMLGFLLGGAFVLALWAPWKNPRPAAPLPAPPARAVLEPAKPRPPRLTTIEAVFAEWGRHAAWADDTTEVVLWNEQTRAFDLPYEVRRRGDALYFRSLTTLTRRVINRGKPMPECPLQFTETEEQFREWLEHGRRERK